MTNARNPYRPTVRPRSARENGASRLTPGYLDDISDTQTLFFNEPGSTTSRQTLLTPSPGRRIRLVRVTAYQIAEDGLHHGELYFGEGANIAIAPEKAIDYLRVPDLGMGATRTWSRGTGPVGERNEVLSFR
ncbi:MAG: hypothetical protein WD533_01865 [Dehalococcoidia bacterium]